MDDNRNDNKGQNRNRGFFPDSEPLLTPENFPSFLQDAENEEYVEPTVINSSSDDTDDYEKTQEMSSIQSARASSEEYSGIIPREEFTDLNSSDDDVSKTRCMDSIADEEENPAINHTPPQNPVVRRPRRKKKINHVRTMGQIFLGAVLSVTAICLGIFFSIKVIGALRDITGMAKERKEMEFEITEDMNVNTIVDQLYENGMIEMPSLMKLYISFTKNGDGFLNGPHTINSNMSYNNIIEALKTEKEFSETIQVVIPEGLSVVEIGKLLEENYVCRAVDFEAYVKTKQNKFDFEEKLKNNPNRMFMLEGYLFPDTYEFYVIDYLKKDPNYDTSTWAKKAADKMMSNFEDRITKKMKLRMSELGMTLDETIILASIIQREGTNEENMAMISSVFHNRLNDPENFPNLESDAVLTYYINGTIVPRTTSSNKEQMEKIKEAYNTYSCVGLPAGAICNPGLDAITAALYPDDTDYYFFLAARDGTFYWAETMEQHEQNIIDADLHWDDEQGDQGDE